MRALQFIKFWEAAGNKVSVLQRENRTGLKYRLRFLLKLIGMTYKADVIFLQKPNLSAPLLLLLQLSNSVMVTDFDDAVWADYRDEMGSAVSRRLGERLMKALRSSQVVITGSNYLAEWTREKIKNKKVVVVPPSVDLEFYNPMFGDRDKQIITVGWIGSDSNLVELSIVENVLREFSVENKIRFLIISNRIPNQMRDFTEFVEWNLEREVELLSAIDVGIMPLIDNARSRGRCGYKAIQYMALGLPVICSPVGSAMEVVEDGVTGIWASSEMEWKAALGALIDSKELREKLGRAGRMRIETYYGTQGNSRRLLEAFKDTQ